MTEHNAEALRKEHYNATLVWLREANPDLRVFRVRPDFDIPPHKPGQYSTLGLGNWEPRVEGCQPESPETTAKPKLIRRAYSISSSILDEAGNFLDHPNLDWLEFYIVLVRQTGQKEAPALTPRLFALEQGARLFLGEKITGRYTTEDLKPDDTAVFLATGTGEAPHNYMIWDLLRRGHRGRIVSVCCVRYLRDLAYLETHKQLMARFSNYCYIWLTTREADVKQKVYIQDLVASGELEKRAGIVLDPASTHVYLCGNPKMIGVPKIDRKTGVKTYPQPTGTVEILEQRGFSIDQPAQKIRGNIHFEEYW